VSSSTSRVSTFDDCAAFFFAIIQARNFFFGAGCGFIIGNPSFSRDS
jgi:hypothetical protein